MSVDVAEAAKAAADMTIDEGRVIFNEGQASDHAYLIVSGRVELIKASADGPLRLSQSAAGEWLGEMAVLDGGLHGTTARALSKVVLRPLTREQLLALMHEQPDTAVALLTASMRRLRRSYQLLATPEQSESSSAPGLLGALILRLRPRDVVLRRLRIEFEPDAVEIEERPVPFAARALLLTIAALVVSTIVWASLASLDRIVTASGHLTTVSARISVQPLATSVVRSFSLRPGQVVQKGEMLASLDPTFANADERSARAQTVAGSAEIARLEAELRGDAEPGQFSTDAAEQRHQVELFLRRRAERTSAFKAYDEEIRDLQVRRKTLEADRIHVEAQRVIVEHLEKIRSELYAQGNGSLVNLIDAQREMAANRREADRVVHELAETDQKVATARAKTEAARSEMTSKLTQELETPRKDFAKAAEALTKQERLSDLVELRSPARAMVLDVAERTAGSVVREGDTLVTLVPLDGAVEIDASVEPRDIAPLRVGDIVRIKLDAFPYQKYGTLDGSIKAVNGDVVDTEVNGHKSSVYKLRIAIVKNNLHGLPADVALLPGMSAQCEIVVGHRRVMSYFLYPVIRALDSGLREP
ncbi:MAG TPA: HlyD family type I secretion periplasmic adaptor subunit [Patescibacteria group bacterium]|nr:HlyD family type I secretion periplasmic adaptor subunit [Patescibacteria group bacterium]